MTDGYRKIDRCRLCGSTDIHDLIDFGEVALGNNLQDDRASALQAETYPLELRQCEDCGHFQLGHAVSPDRLYATNYTYLSGIGPSFIKHFGEYAQWAQQTTGLQPGSLIVDVGSNDGTALKAFKAMGHRVCGVDPASLAAGLANEAGIETLNSFFDSAAVDEIIDRHGQADFVTSHNVLAHVDDLAAVFANIRRLLKNGGFFCFEIGYFGEVLRSGCFDTIYHEHLDYHHAAPLVRHLTALGFDVVDLSVNAVQGGTLRLLMRKSEERTIEEQPALFLEQERSSVLYDSKFLAQWKAKIEAQMSDFRRIVDEYSSSDAVICGYGAPTKATLLMKVAGLGSDAVEFVAEDNPLKVGRFLPRSGVPIRETRALVDARPDVVVVFAWNFIDDIAHKLRAELGGKATLVVPLPELRTIQL